MSIKRFVYASAAAGLMLAVGSSPTAYASNDHAKRACILERHAPVAVAPFTFDWGTEGSYSSSGGAQLFVPASEGLNQELLAASMQKAVAAAKSETAGQKSSGASCNLPPLDVHVSVVSASNGYWVQLLGHHPNTSAMLAKWARDFMPSAR